jgi:hypothetical protein
MKNWKFAVTVLGKMLYQDLLGWTKDNGKLQDTFSQWCNFKPTTEVKLYSLIK